MGSKRFAGAFAVMAALTCSGCAEDEGAFQPPVTASAKVTSTSPSPSVVGGRAGVPDDAKKHTRAGAEAFARYFIEMVNLAWTTPDRSAVEGLGAETCDFCKAMAREALDMEAKDERYESNPLKVLAMGPLDGAGPDDEFFTVQVLEPAAHRVDRNGKKVDGQSADRYVAHIGVTWVHQQWSVIEVEDPAK